MRKDEFPLHIRPQWKMSNTHHVIWVGFCAKPDNGVVAWVVPILWTVHADVDVYKG